MAMRTPPSWLQQGSHTAENDRLTMQALYSSTGVIGSSSLAVTAQGTPNMTVNVASGWAAVVGTTQTNMGVYVGYNDATTVLTIAAAPSSNSRIDLVCLTINDAYYTGSTNNAVLQVISGTVASSPVAPSLPANSISLATIVVGTSVTSIGSSNITDTRVVASTNLVDKSLLTVWTTGTRPTAVLGKVGFNTSIGSAEVYNGVGWMPLDVNAFATSASRVSSVTSPQGGQVSYLVSTDANDTAHQLDFYNGSAWEPVRGFDVAGKNKIINGGFDFWQRGTSFAGAGWTADRWYVGTDKTCTASRQAFTAGTAPVTGYEGHYFLRVAPTTAGTYLDVLQRIEDVRTFAGQTVTYSFWAKVASGTQTITPRFDQYFGPSGSSTVYTASAITHTVTTSWQRFTGTMSIPSVSGKTIDDSLSSTQAIFLPITNVGSATFTMDLWGVQLEAGSVATPFSRAGGTIQGELAACQRYYQRLVTGGNANAYFGNGWTTTITNANCFFPLKTTMRIVPTSSEVGGNLQIQDTTNATFGASSASIITTQSTPDLIALSIGVSGAIAGRAVFWGASSNANSYFGVSAEL